MTKQGMMAYISGELTSGKYSGTWMERLPQIPAPVEPSDKAAFKKWEKVRKESEVLCRKFDNWNSKQPLNVD